MSEKGRDLDVEAVWHDLAAELRTFLRRRTRTSDEAEDLLQTVFLKLQERRDQLELERVGAWLRTVARNALVDHRRSAATANDSLEESALQDLPEPPPDEVARCVAALLRLAEPSDRDLLERVDMDGESQAELARELGLSSSGLKSRVQRARTRLRARLSSCCELELDGLGRPLRLRRKEG